MGRPRKTSGSAASPRPAATAPKAGLGTPRSSATSRTVPMTGANPTAPAPKSGSSRGSGPEKETYYAKPRGARESVQPRSAAASDGQRRGPRKSDGGGATASGGVNPSATSDAASKTQGRARGLLAPLSPEKVAEVEMETRGQWSNPEWHKWRENRITASIAHTIANSKFANGRCSEVPQSYLKKVVRTSFEYIPEGRPCSVVRTSARMWGISNEKNAVEAYIKSSRARKPVTVKGCGLFIDKDNPWLAASPDRIVQDARTGKDLRLLEVKCPYKHRNKTVSEACQDDDFSLENEGSSYSLKKTHCYYTQVQVQMKTSGVHKADFVVYTTKETAIAPVDFDPSFWKQIFPKLEKFYMDAVVPYLEKNNPSVLWANEE